VPSASAAVPPPDDPDGGVSTQIIGGGNASNAPRAARLFVNGQQNCSATIIAPTFILTAKHCLSSAGTYTFRIGGLDQTGGGVVATGVTISRNPTADLAIVRIDRSVATTYSPLGTTANVAVNQTVQIYRWGATCTNQPEINCQSRLLKVAAVGVTSASVNGRDAFGGIAVGATRVDGIAAGGDSGGPMFGAGRQVGVASTSDRGPTHPNLTRYRGWIQSVAGV
jgi:secreted trypsin-like serine protease